MARPSKYTAQTVERIIEAIAKGASLKLAAAYGGISYDALNEWMHRNRQFRQQIESAEAHAAARWLDHIELAAQEGAWQAAAWKLERRYPDDYGRRERQDVHHSGAVKSIVEYSNDWKTPTVQLPAGRVVESEPAQ